MAEPSRLNGASDEGTHRRARMKKVKPHWKRGRMVGKLSKATGLKPSRVRATLRKHGYDYPWDDEERARAILAQAGLLDSNAPAKPNGHSPAGRTTNYPDQRTATAPDIARELKMSDKTLYAWMHKAGYKPPWDDRRRILEIAVARGNRKPDVQRRARKLLGEMEITTGVAAEPAVSPQQAVQRLPESAPSPVNNRVLEAVVYLRQAEAAIFADIRAKRLKTLSRAHRRTLDAKAVLEGETQD